MTHSPVIWLQTGTGQAFDLLQPIPAMVDFGIDIAEALARIPRFNGHVRSGGFSVAQHSVMGADELYRETGRRDLAAAFLLHDGREFVLGDKPTPVKWAEIAIIREMFGSVAAEQARQALHELGVRADRAIYARAGLTFPLDPKDAEAVKVMDRRMAKTEFMHLLGKPALPLDPAIATARPIRLLGKFRVWPWPEAADEFRARLTAYLPASSKPAARRAPARRPEPMEA